MNTARETNPLLSESAALQVRRADCHIRFSSALALVVVLSAASNALVLDEAPNPVSGAVAAPDDPDVVKYARDTVGSY
jgi:hypothetical protein